MKTGLRILAVTDDKGRILDMQALMRAEPLYRELRPQLPPHYLEKMQRVFSEGGRLLLAVSEEPGYAVLGLALYRIYEDTANGRKFYCDDLVTTASRRSQGVGHALMDAMRALAHEEHCTSFILDSGTQRTQAHRFYFREGMAITSFNFKQPL